MRKCKYNDLDEITENLYLGDYSASVDIRQLKEKGITKVLSVYDYTKGPKYDSSIMHKTIFIMDDVPQNIIKYFGECLNFIKGDEKVLVHCMAGASRSATVVIAYLMWVNKWKFEEAFSFVKSKRPIACPNDGFQDQLKLFEKLLINNIYDINKIQFSKINWKSDSLL